MEKEFHFRLAEKKDDASIRRLFSQNPMSGGIRISYDMAPSYFDAISVQGHDPIVLVSEKDDTIIACGAALKRNVYLDGISSEIGYLSGLRVAPGFRNLELLSKGYQFLKELHENRIRVPFYLTSIVEGNHAAMKVLGSGRAGLPSYHELGRYSTFAIPALNFTLSRRKDKFTISNGSALPLGDILEFLNREGSKKQFFPVLSEKDFNGTTGQFRNLSGKDFLVAMDGKEIVGTLAIWNQDPFRRIMIEGYSGIAKGIKTLSAIVAKTGLTVPLPKPGTALSTRIASCIAVKDGRADIFKWLLDSALTETAKSKAGFLLIGLAKNDPLLEYIAHPLKIRYDSRIFVVSWDSEYKINPLWKNFHLEPGTL